MTPFERFIAALKAHGSKVLQTTPGKARAQCPSHDDRRPSLSITAKDGRVLMKCFSGCRTSQIVKAVGLKMADLFDERAPIEPDPIIAEYPYEDLDGAVIAVKTRSRSKRFRWQTPMPDGTYRPGLDKERRPTLYGLSGLRNAAPVTTTLVVEGEKAVDVLGEAGFVATCPPAGASRWLDAWSSLIWSMGATTVVVLADNDQIGRQHAERVAESLLRVASGRERVIVKVVHLQLLQAGQDVVDWLVGRDSEHLIAVLQLTEAWRPGLEAERRAARKRQQAAERQRRRRMRLRDERHAAHVEGARHAAYDPEPVEVTRHATYVSDAPRHAAYVSEDHGDRHASRCHAGYAFNVPSKKILPRKPLKNA